MKKVPFILIGLAIFVGCSKKNNINPKNEKPSILGRWNYVKDVYIDSSQGYYDKDTIHYLQGSYANFSNDGKIYVKASNNSGDFEYDTVSYKIDGSNFYLIYPGDSLNPPEIDTGYIQTLTDSSLILYSVQHDTLNGLPFITRTWGYMVR